MTHANPASRLFFRGAVVVIVIDERHLRTVLAEFADYYNRDRPHRSLGLQSPLRSDGLVRGRVVSRPVLGGLHHVYARAA